MKEMMLGTCLLTSLVADGCRPGDVLSVPPPAGVLASSGLGSRSGAEEAFNGAKARFFVAFASSAFGVLEYGGELTDEFTWSFFSGLGFLANIDARVTVAGSGYPEAADAAIGALLSARSSLLVSATELTKYEPPAGRPKVGEAYALAGYAELLLAEHYCAGVPLSDVEPNGGIQYGTPLSTDSILAVAEGHFDSALSAAGSDPVIAPLGGVGLARVRLDRGHAAAAAAPANAVPTSFVYNAELAPDFTSGVRFGSYPNIYAAQLPPIGGTACGYVNVSDREGGNGLNFISANDPRLVVDSTIQATCDGGTWYYPVKFGNPSTFVPLATGVEARLVESEAALAAQQIGVWATDLNTLRANAPGTYLELDSAVHALPIDSTAAASAATRVDVMFRERAFWLFGTGTRLGDVRRLIRQYGRDAETVFPTGPYPNGHNPNLPSPLPNYGTDVALTLPTAASGYTTTNPNYKGCLTSAKAA